MARRKKQDAIDQKENFFRYLRTGKTLEQSASCAGISEEVAKGYLLDTTTNFAHQMAEKALKESIDIIMTIAKTAGEEETRLNAAKELRKFAFDLLKLEKTDKSTTNLNVNLDTKRDLWDL